MSDFSDVGHGAQEVAQQALRATLKYTAGGDIELTISTSGVNVVRDVCLTAVTLGAIYSGYQLLRPLIIDAVTTAFGGERDDQEIRNIRPGSLIVLIHCFTDERFLEILQDYENDKLKERLEKEFSKINFHVKEVKVRILNPEEVNIIRETIRKRYANDLYLETY